LAFFVTIVKVIFVTDDITYVLSKEAEKINKSERLSPEKDLRWDLE